MTKLIEVEKPEKYIDHGFFRLSQREAKELCGGRLPRPGYEKLVKVNGIEYWIAQTPVGGRWVWSARRAHITD